MNKKLLSTGIFLTLFGLAGLAQNSPSIVPKNSISIKNIPTLHLTPPNMEAIRLEDEERDKNGVLYRIGVANYTNITTQNSGAWTTDALGNRTWQLHIQFPGAEALSFLFERFHLYGAATFDVLDVNGRKLHETFSATDVLDHGRQHMELCFGDDMILQITEPAGTQASDIYIDRVMYGYRSTGNTKTQKDFGDSESCEINVNCTPVGDSWQDERNGVARILVVDGNSQGWCTGSLVNNTAQDCKPYFLTALHCGVTATTANLTQWIFYFKYESSNCTSSNPGTNSTKNITGCVKMASSNDGGGNSGSDFLLVQLGSLASEATTVTKLKTAAISAYWNGWDANNTATTGGVGIHHPSGDIKKISTFSGATTSATYGGNVANTHWRLTWTANSNGHGVTEPGSSGSPIFNNSNGRIIGTLTGGGASCAALTSPDFYGKMSFHWTANGTPTNEQLKPFLDPGNTGVTVFNGSSNPCGAVSPVAPVAQFFCSPTTLNPGQPVTFTDQSTNTPTSWLWAISPATGWTFTTGTTTSQNPVVTFNTAGQYTITLTATNATGSDQEVKTNYITVTSSTAPCTAASTATCGNQSEYIAGVVLNTINSTSTCSNYTSQTNTTTLTKGSAYTATITTAIVGSTNAAFIDDELAVWIDFNDDNDFNDVGERIGYSIATANAFNTTFNFTVPATAATGSVKMRVRFHYSGADVGDGPISPCGTSTYGEVEDYNITIVGTAGLDESVIFDAVSIYPNPVNNTLNADLSQIEMDGLQVELLDVTGKVLAIQTNVSGTIAQFDMSNFAKGMYHVRLSAGAVNTTKRIIKL